MRRADKIENKRATPLSMNRFTAQQPKLPKTTDDNSPLKADCVDGDKHWSHAKY